MQFGFFLDWSSAQFLKLNLGMFSYTGLNSQFALWESCGLFLYLDHHKVLLTALSWRSWWTVPFCVFMSSFSFVHQVCVGKNTMSVLDGKSQLGSRVLASPLRLFLLRKLFCLIYLSCSHFVTAHFWNALTQPNNETGQCTQFTKDFICIFLAGTGVTNCPFSPVYLFFSFGHR